MAIVLVVTLVYAACGVWLGGSISENNRRIAESRGRTVRKKDQFWEYVEKQNGRILCKFCQRDFTGGISRIKSHLAGVQCRGIKICSNVPEDVKIAALRAIDASKKKTKITVSSSNVVETATVSCSASSSIEGATHAYPVTTNISDELDSHAQLEPLDVMPFYDTFLNVIPFCDRNSIVYTFMSSDELQSFSGFQTEFDSGIDLDIDSDIEKEVVEHITEVKKSIARTGCCSLLYEGWHVKEARYVITYVSSRTSRPEVVVKPSNIKADLRYTIKTLSPNQVQRVISVLGPDVHLYKYIQITITSCASTLIENILAEIYISVQLIRDVLYLGNFIGTYIFMHDVKLSPRMEYKVSKKYTEVFTTSCANGFLMLQSLMEVENELQTLQLPLTSTYFTSCFVINDEGMESHHEFVQVSNHIIQCSEFWRAGKEVVQVLQPLFQVLHLVDGYRSISGYLYEALKRAQVKIKEGLNKNQEKYKKVWHIFEGRRTKIVHPIHAAAAFLNPTYMFSENFEEDIEIKEGINYILEKLVASEDREAFVTQMLCYHSKEPSIFTTTAKIMLRTSHPRVWWDYCGDHLPVLRKYAIRMMSQTCTAPSCKQRRLQPEMPDCNDATSMEKYMTSGAQHEESIDLDKLAGHECECPEEIREEFEDSARKKWEAIWSRLDSQFYMRIIDSLVIK